MNYDTYGEVINGEDTYRNIAQYLKLGQPVLIGWTDEQSTHFDILFTLGAKVIGANIQGGVRGTDLFISIMRLGAFGFEIEHTATSGGYYAEKLSSYIGTTTSEKLAELFNGVKSYLL